MHGTTVNCNGSALTFEDASGDYGFNITNGSNIFALMYGDNASVWCGDNELRLQTPDIGSSAATGQILRLRNAATGEVRYTPYSLPNGNGSAGQVLTTNGAGSATWETRITTEYAAVFMPNNNQPLLDIPWVEIRNRGVNGALSIINTDPTYTLKYSYSVNNGTPTSGNLAAGSTLNITVGFNEVDIKLSRYTSTTSRFAHFKGLASSGWLKGFVSYDQ